MMIIDYEINRSDIEDMVEVYRAYRQYEITKLTKLFNPISSNQDNVELVPIKLDYILSKLDARVYDIRDFMNNNSFREQKEKLYSELKIKLLLNNTSNE